MQFSPWLLIFGSIIISDAEHNIQKRDSSSQKKVVCYYTNWSVYRPGTAKFSPQNINPYLCTHLIYAFGGLDKDNGLRPYDKYQDIEQGGYAKFNGLKTYNKNLKTLLAIGGWNEGSARFSKLVDDEDNRKQFVKNCIKFLRQNNFDGLDLDWEYPAFRDGSKPSDKENYASLVRELREEFNRESSKTGRTRLLLTMAVPAGIEYVEKGYDIPELNKHLDFMNLLTYDYHSSYEPAVNHHSPLYPLEEDSEYNFDAKLNIDHTIKHYIASGADKDKLVLGIPTYGRSYTLFNKESTDIGAPSDGPGEKGEATREKGYLAYYEICGNLKKDDTWNVEQPKPRAMGPYAYKDNQWVGYDDEEFVKLKAKYVNENDLGGIMFWSIDNDDFRGNCHSRAYPLIEAGKEALLGDSKSESNQGKEIKVLPKSRTKPKPRTTTSAPQEKSAASTTTPEPPTTPDTGTDFTCKDEGFFPHPRECKKYFWCLDSGPSNLGIVAHQFTCPSGLVFNKASDSCDYSRNVVCKDKKPSEMVATTTTTTTTAKPIKIGTKYVSTTTSTTTTSTHTPYVEEDVEEEFEEEEDPKEIKQLITLIKKLGGVAELEKQLNIKDGSTEVTTPAISKSLYNKVLKIPSNRFQSTYINGPGPQSEGLDSKDDSVDYKKDKPQYVTIRRQRPSKDVSESNKEQEEEDTSIDTTTERFKPTYKTVDRSRYRDLGEAADENSESDSLPKYTTISRTRSTESEAEEPTSPKYVTLRRQRPAYKEEEVSDEEISPVSSTASTSTAPRYVSLLRQRSTTTTSAPEDRVFESTTRENSEEPRENINTKVSDEVFTTEPSVTISTTPFQTEPFTEIITTTVPNVTAEKTSETITTNAASSTTTAKGPIFVVAETVPDTTTTTTSTTRAPTSTITNVVTSIYEAATERQRVRVKNIQNFLLEHKKTEPISRSIGTQAVTQAINPSLTTTTMENVIATEEPTQKSILKGRFGGGQAHFRPTLQRKPTAAADNAVETTTAAEKRAVETTTERKFLRTNKYANRFSRPSTTESLVETTTGKRFARPTTAESTIGLRQPNRFRLTTAARDADSSTTPSSRRSFSRFRSTTTETPLPNDSTEAVQKSRFYRGRKLTPPSSTTSTTTTTTTEATTTISTEELLSSEENGNNVTPFETTSYPPATQQSTANFPSTNNYYDETSGGGGSGDDEEFKITTIRSFEPTKYSTNNEVNTEVQQPPTTTMLNKSFRGVVRANDDKPSRPASSGRQNSRFLKDEQRIVYIRVMPSLPDGRSVNEVSSHPVKNVTRNRGRIRAFDSLELNTLSDGLTEDYDRPNELFRGSETNFRVRQPTTTTTTSTTAAADSSTEEILKNRNRQRITRPVQRSTTTTTTTTTEDSLPLSSTESYLSKANRRRKFRPEYKTTPTPIYEEEFTTTPRARNPERRFRSRTTVPKNVIATSPTPQTLEETDRKVFTTSSQPYYDETSLFAKTRDDRKIGGSAEDLANTAVVAIHTLATAPPTNYDFRSSTHSPQQQSVFRETTQKQNYFEPRVPHSKDAFNGGVHQQQIQQPQQQQLLPPQPARQLTHQPPQSSINLPVAFQPAPFQPSPFQAGPFQPLPYPALPYQSNQGFSPVTRLLPPASPTAPALPPATSRQTFLLRRGPPRTTPLQQAAPPPTTPRPAPPQYLNDNTQEQYADYSEPEQASDSGEQRVALKGKVRIHGDGYIECLDMGSFPHPFSCQKFISCAKTEYGALFGWEYTCPKGLSFDPVGGICNWSSGGPVCNN